MKSRIDCGDHEEAVKAGQPPGPGRCGSSRLPPYARRRHKDKKEGPQLRCHRQGVTREGGTNPQHTQRAGPPPNTLRPLRGREVTRACRGSTTPARSTRARHGGRGRGEGISAGGQRPPLVTSSARGGCVLSAPQGNGVGGAAGTRDISNEERGITSSSNKKREGRRAEWEGVGRETAVSRYARRGKTPVPRTTRPSRPEKVGQNVAAMDTLRKVWGNADQIPVQPVGPNACTDAAAPAVASVTRPQYPPFQLCSLAHRQPGGRTAQGTGSGGAS